jgi:hypothetical protein
VPINGISALAWDQDEEILYAVTDRGWLHHLRPEFIDGELSEVRLLDSFQLRDKKDKKLGGKDRDSEGVHVLNGDNGKRGDSELLISFEQTPRILRFSAKGKQTGKVKLPKMLRKVGNYSAPNNALEAVTHHQEYGVLTIPQRAVKQGHFLHAVDGRRWPYSMAPVRGNEVVSLEVMENGGLLIMERAYSTGLFPKLVVTFRKGEVEADELKLTTIAQLDAADGWTLDNFEGMSRHKDGHYFIVSDNNAKVFQRNLLYYFSFK